MKQPSYQSSNNRSRRFASRHLTLCLVLLLLGAAIVLSAILTGSPNKVRPSAAETVGVSGADASAEASNRPATEAQRKQGAKSKPGALKRANSISAESI